MVSKCWPFSPPLLFIAVPFLDKVVLHPGPKMMNNLPMPASSAVSLHKEYSGLECAVELVNNLQEAIDTINIHGSAHTDAIITHDG